MAVRESIREACGLVLRQSASDPRVYLVLRAPELRAFGGLWAFPGGTLHDADRRAQARVAGGDPALATALVAVAREAMEETGLWLATTPTPLSAEERVTLRTQTLEVGDAFASALERGSSAIDARVLPPLTRLITPDFALVRFDTQFFQADLASFPHAGEPTIWPGELVDQRWDTPHGWLERWRAGDALIAPPVVMILQVLARCGWEGAAAELARITGEFAEGRIHPIFFNPAVQLIPLRTPTIPPATHTNAYLVGTDPAYLIDPATPDPHEQQRFDAVLAAAQSDGRRMAAILLTHHHPDHVGAVEHVRARWRLPVWAHARTRELLAGQVAVDRVLDEGDRLPLGRAPNGRDGWELLTLFTPGHAAGHLAFFEGVYGSLIIGDMLSTLSSILVDPRDGDMTAYMQSLARLATLAARVVFPAHGPATAAGAAAVAGQLAHRRQREAAILAAVRGGAERVGQVVERVYTDVPASMHGFAALSIESVLVKLEREGHIVRTGDVLRAARA